jgi:nitrite reductase/ring-hydroxylating ferredoxin subunit
VEDQVVLLVHLEGEFHALSGWCTHQGTSLALGSLSERTLTCYAHLWSFDVRSGEPIWPPIARIAPGYRLRRYPVHVADGNIYVSSKPGRGGLN